MFLSSIDLKATLFYGSDYILFVLFQRCRCERCEAILLCIVIFLKSFVQPCFKKQYRMVAQDRRVEDWDYYEGMDFALD